MVREIKGWEEVASTFVFAFVSGNLEDVGFFLIILVFTGAAEGVAEGVAKGVAEGVAKGVAEGVAEGVADLSLVHLLVFGVGVCGNDVDDDDVEG